MTSDPNPYVFIHTIGCQMNVYDADQIEAGLNTMGFSRTWNLEQADAVILNTCTIREKAEQKAVSFIGRLVKLKQNKPHLIVGVGGCLAQQQGRALLKRFPHVDIVFGTRTIDQLPVWCRIITLSIRIVAGCVALYCQVTRRLKRPTTVDFTSVPAIIFIHCYQPYFY